MTNISVEYIRVFLAPGVEAPATCVAPCTPSGIIVKWRNDGDIGGTFTPKVIVTNIDTGIQIEMTSPTGPVTIAAHDTSPPVAIYSPTLYSGTYTFCPNENPTNVCKTVTVTGELPPIPAAKISVAWTGVYRSLGDNRITSLTTCVAPCTPDYIDVAWKNDGNVDSTFVPKMIVTNLDTNEIIELTSPTTTVIVPAYKISPTIVMHSPTLGVGTYKFCPIENPDNVCTTLIVTGEPYIPTANLVVESINIFTMPGYVEVRTCTAPCRIGYIYVTWKNNKNVSITFLPKIIATNIDTGVTIELLSPYDPITILPGQIRREQVLTPLLTAGTYKLCPIENPTNVCETIIVTGKPLTDLGVASIRIFNIPGGDITTCVAPCTPDYVEVVWINGSDTEVTFVPKVILTNTDTGTQTELLSPITTMKIPARGSSHTVMYSPTLGVGTYKFCPVKNPDNICATLIVTPPIVEPPVEAGMGGILLLGLGIGMLYFMMKSKK